MGIGNVLVLAQVTSFLISFIFSFFIFIPVWINQNDFKGNCLLYSYGEWVQESSQLSLLITWGPNSACNFTIFFGVVVMLLSIFYVVWDSRYLLRGNDSTWLDAFVTCGVTLMMTVVLFANALTVSVGFGDWCATLTGTKSEIKSCEMGQYEGTLVLKPRVDINTDYYYMQYQMAQFGLWATWLCWLVLAFLSSIKLYRYHRQEAFLTSMNRERERLIQRVGHSQSTEGPL